MKKCKLNEICRITSSKRIFESEYVNLGIPFIRGQEISDGSISNNKSLFSCYISQKRFNELKSSNGVPKIGDILITAVGTIGNLYFVDRKFDFYFKDGNVIRLTDFDSIIYPKYLYYYMKSPLFKRQLEFAMIGAVQKALTMVMLSKIDINIPSYSMQVKIANILENIDNEIKVNNSVNSELESMAKTIYDYWFLQFEFPNEEGKPYKSSGGKMVWNEVLKRQIPQYWNVGTLEDLFYIKNGKNHQELNDGDVPVYGSGGIMRHVNKSLYEGESVLIPRKGTLNNILYVNCHFWTVDTMFYTKMKKNNCAIYSYYVTKQYDFERMNTGTGVPSMTSSIVYKLKSVIPDEITLKKFDEKVQSIYGTIRHNEKENDKLASLRDFLLPLLMNGQVGFKETINPKEIEKEEESMVSNTK